MIGHKMSSFDADDANPGIMSGRRRGAWPTDDSLDKMAADMLIYYISGSEQRKLVWVLIKHAQAYLQRFTDLIRIPAAQGDIRHSNGCRHTNRQAHHPQAGTSVSPELNTP